MLHCNMYFRIMVNSVTKNIYDILKFENLYAKQEEKK